MRPAIFFLALSCALAAVAHGALKVKSLCPAKAHGRFTGQISAKLEEDLEELTRVKRRGGKRSGGGGGGRGGGGGERRKRTNTPTTTTTTSEPAPTTEAPLRHSECSTTSSVYRTENGRCNNLQNPDWGAVLASFRRLLPPAYQYNADGSNGPLLRSLTTNNPLPDVRTISVRVHDDLNRPSRQDPVMVMQWGQFLDHDITGTPVSDAECCSQALIDSKADQHSDVSEGGPCFPILIGDTDPFFTAESSHCLEFTRSLRTVPEDGTDDAEEQQVNLLTSFVDASNVYGTSKEEMDNLRGDNGELREGDEGQLPRGDNSTCIRSDNDGYCLLAGDHRANVFPGLGAMHTVFLRLHNKLAQGLRFRHADWSSDTVFQETRKIVGALMQHITYTEYLPRIVGTVAMETYGLSEDAANYAYNSLEDPTLANVFSTAAFRFGHSAIPAALSINGRSVPIQQVFNNPGTVLNELQGIVEGLLQDPGQRVDRWYTPGMTNHLFETEGQNGSDIVSLNIQRGRDHGTRPYNKWRSFCSQNETTDFQELQSGANLYQRVYESPHDIDLYSGALSENTVAGGSVGPTYACLIGMQFESLKYGDRFWYERTSSEGFTASQLAELKKMTLSGVLCEAFDDQLDIQPSAFRLPNINGVKILVEREMKEKGWTWGRLERIAADRHQWRALVEALCAT